MISEFVILDVLAGNPTEEDADYLQEHVASHIEKHKRAYPGRAENLEPKFHAALHVPKRMADLRRLLGCWAPERRHKTAKTYGTHVTGGDESWERYVTHHVVNQLIDDLEQADHARLLNECSAVVECLFLWTPGPGLED